MSVCATVVPRAVVQKHAAVRVLCPDLTLRHCEVVVVGASEMRTTLHWSMDISRFNQLSVIHLSSSLNAV